MRTRLFVARHGQAAYVSSVISDEGGWLTPVGREQARALGRTLRDAGVRHVWTSPLSRAVQTAELAAAALGLDDVVVREGLREYGVGSAAGRSGHEHTYIGPAFEQWVHGDDSAAIPGGERVSDIVDRVQSVLREVVVTHPGETALVVSHGGAILASVPTLCGLPRESVLRYTIDAGAHLVVEFDRDDGGGGAWRLLPEEVPDR